MQFLFVESISIYIRDLQYPVKFPPQHLLAGKPRRCPVVHDSGADTDGRTFKQFILNLRNSIVFDVKVIYHL
jgi:hypothetical protein